MKIQPAAGIKPMSPRLWTCVVVSLSDLDSEDDLVLEGVGILVAGKQNIGILEQLHPDHVTCQERELGI